MAAVGSTGNRSQGKGYTREAAGAEAGHDKGAQGRGPGLGHRIAHGKGGGGGGGVGGGGGGGGSILLGN